MAAILRLNPSIMLRNILSQTNIKAIRLISTSQKNRETATVSPSVAEVSSKADTKTVVKNKNWVSYGFHFQDEAHDRSATKSTFFFSVTLCLVWGTFIWSYLPDPQLRDWAQREGYLVLRQREAAGVDLISPNYIDPSAIELPSDEELGTTEIII